MSRKILTAIASALLVGGVMGVAAASNHAAPGDPLYGIDRALEQINVNHGGFEERLDEANALAGKGRAAEALAHVADALADVGAQNDIETLSTTGNLDEAIAAITAALEKINANENANENAGNALEKVLGMLEYMNTTSDTGSVFGQTVADMAKGLGGEDTGGPPSSVPPVDVPVGPGAGGDD